MISFILIGSLFTLAGCAQLYKFLGLTKQQTQNQIEKDQTDRQKIIEGIRLTTTELITTAIAGAGAILSGILAKWLGTERKITNTLITAVEKSATDTVKETIHNFAGTAGIEPQLHKRVKALT